MRKLGLILVFAAMFAATNLTAESVAFKWLRELTCEQIRPYSDEMSAFKENGKWGFMDISGKVAIQPVFDECHDFVNGYAVVRKGAKWGVIDRKGESSTGFGFDKMNNFSDGVAYAEIGNACYYVYPRGHKQLLSPKFVYRDYSEGMAPIKDKKKDKWGYINKNGVVVIEPQFDTVYKFSGNIALVKNKNKAFYINKKGGRKNISEMYTERPLEFVNGFAKIKDERGIRFISQNDYKLLPFLVSEATDFNSEGIAATLMPDNSMHYLNSQGRLMLSTEYEKIGNFSDGIAWVSKNGKYGFIDRKGNLVIDTLFTSATDFKDGIAFVSYGNRLGSIKIMDEYDVIPKLAIENIIIKDANLNNKVEAEEKFAIAVTLHNDSDEDLFNVNLHFAGQADQTEWFHFDGQSTFLPLIKAHSDTTVTFGGSANLSLVSENINLEFRGGASNLMNSVKKQFSFQSLGVNACKPIITKYWVYKEDHTPIEKGDVVNLKLSVKNDGSDLAKNVEVALQWPSGITNFDKSLRIPVIRPGETTEISSKFVVDTLSDNGLTVVARLTEYTNKHKDIKYLSFQTGRMNAEINLEGGMQSMMYQYSPDERYYAQNMPTIGKPQITSSSSSESTQEITKTDLGQSELLSGMKQMVEPDQNKFALVIGNEDYNSFKQTTSYEVNVDYALQDAKTFATYATNYMGVPKENVILLQNATYAQMNFNINKLIAMSKTNPGNIELIIFYAGHGQHDVDSKDTYLVPVDVSISSPTAGIKLEKMYADLGTSRAKRTYIFMDACYSGVGRGIVIKPKQALVNGNTVVFTATSSSQRSMPYREKEHGMFTYFLLKTLKETGGNISVGRLYEITKREVVKNSIWINNSEQTPELLSGEDIDSGWEDWKL